MCSSPPEKAQKSQLAVEQPPAGGYWNLQKKKKIPYIKRQKRHCETVGGAHSL